MARRRKLLRKLERLPLASLSALSVGPAAAFFCYAMPVFLFERLVTLSGLPTLVDAAAPPLGDTARLLFTAVAGLAAATVAGLAVMLADRLSAPRGRVPVVALTPRVRREDRHPDAPARRPISAAEELTPAHDDMAAPEPVEQAPLELIDRIVEPPLAAAPADLHDDFNETVPDDAVAADMSAVEPLETVETPPVVTEPSIASLMARLESGAVRRATLKRRDAADHSSDGPLGDALAELRRIARR